MRRDLQLDVLCLFYVAQAKAPLTPLLFIDFFCVLLEVIHEVLVGCVDQGLRQFIPGVHPLYQSQVLPFTVVLGKLGVDDFGVLECELLGDRMTAWFGVGLLVDAFEGPEPVTTVLVALGARGPGNQRKHLEYIAGSG